MALFNRALRNTEERSNGDQCFRRSSVISVAPFLRVKPCLRWLRTLRSLAQVRPQARRQRRRADEHQRRRTVGGPLAELLQRSVAPDRADRAAEAFERAGGALDASLLVRPRGLADRASSGSHCTSRCRPRRAPASARRPARSASARSRPSRRPRTAVPCRASASPRARATIGPTSAPCTTTPRKPKALSR